MLSFASFRALEQSYVINKPTIVVKHGLPKSLVLERVEQDPGWTEQDVVPAQTTKHSSHGDAAQTIDHFHATSGDLLGLKTTTP